MKRQTDAQLIRALVRDLINDIRFSENNDSPPRTTQLRRDVSTLFRERHTTKLDRYGWPLCLKESIVTPTIKPFEPAVPLPKLTGEIFFE